MGDTASDRRAFDLTRLSGPPVRSSRPTHRLLVYATGLPKCQSCPKRGLIFLSPWCKIVPGVSIASLRIGQARTSALKFHIPRFPDGLVQLRLCGGSTVTESTTLSCLPPHNPYSVLGASNGTLWVNR